MAVRIAGVVLPEKRMEITLTYIYGVGRSLALRALKETGVDKNKRPKDLTEEEVATLRTFIEKQFQVEGDLRRERSGNIKRLKEIGSYRGTRHVKKLPIKGRTKTNSRTNRGNVRKTMGSGRKPSAEKT